MQIFVRTFAGTVAALQVADMDTVGSVMERISKDRGGGEYVSKRSLVGITKLFSTPRAQHGSIGIPV